MHGRCGDAGADNADGNWKLGATWKCTDMRSRLSDWLAPPRSVNAVNIVAFNKLSHLKGQLIVAGALVVIVDVFAHRPD